MRRVISKKYVLFMISLMPMVALIIFHVAAKYHEIDAKGGLEQQNFVQAKHKQEKDAIAITRRELQHDANTPGMNTFQNKLQRDDIKAPDLAAVQDELGPSDSEIENLISIAQRDKIWIEQNSIMAAWPDYSEMRASLLKELSDKYELASLNDERVLQIASALRDQYWKNGGDLSKTSYKDAYMARALLEYYNKRNPDDLIIADELIETILASNLTAKIDKKTNRMVRNDQVMQDLLSVRAKQWEIVSSQLEQGRTPTSQDFLRGIDFVYLQQHYNKDQAKKAVGILQKYQTAGNWSKWNELLTHLQEQLSKNSTLNFNIYCAQNGNAYPAEFRYARRAPSFRGPETRQVHLVMDGMPSQLSLSKNNN